MFSAGLLGSGARPASSQAIAHRAEVTAQGLLTTAGGGFWQTGLSVTVASPLVKEWVLGVTGSQWFDAQGGLGRLRSAVGVVLGVPLGSPRFGGRVGILGLRRTVVPGDHSWGVVISSTIACFFPLSSHMQFSAGVQTMTKPLRGIASGIALGLRLRP